MLGWVIACVGDTTDAPAVDAGSPSGDGGGETGDAGALDAAAPDALVLPAPVWPPYSESPDWTSTDSGVATGALFADIDADGVLDLVVANGNDIKRGPIMVYLANADGSLPTRASWVSDEIAYHGHLAAGDVDGDGYTDIVAAIFLGDSGFSTRGRAAYYRNEGGELPKRPTWESEESFYSFRLALGDIDNDGDLDLAAATGQKYNDRPERDRLFINDGGEFQEPSTWKTELSTYSLGVTFVDANHDGLLDLAFARARSPHAIYLNDGTGLPSTEPAWEASGGGFEGNTIDFGDLNGDGFVDLVVSDNKQLGGSGRVKVYCGPDFATCWTSGDGNRYQSAVALADLDGDLDLDLAAGAWWDTVRMYRNNSVPGGVLDMETGPSLTTDTDTVVEAIAFNDMDGAGTYTLHVVADGPLIPLPRRCLWVDSDPPGAVGDGFLTVPGGGLVHATCETSYALDLLISDWTNSHGNDLFLHE